VVLLICIISDSPGDKNGRLYNIDSGKDQEEVVNIGLMTLKYMISTISICFN
jgi:hypothetical protein